MEYATRVPDVVSWVSRMVNISHSNTRVYIISLLACAYMDFPPANACVIILHIHPPIIRCYTSVLLGNEYCVMTHSARVLLHTKEVSYSEFHSEMVFLEALEKFSVQKFSKPLSPILRFSRTSASQDGFYSTIHNYPLIICQSLATMSQIIHEKKNNNNNRWILPSSCCVEKPHVIFGL